MVDAMLHLYVSLGILIVIFAWLLDTFPKASYISVFSRVRYASRLLGLYLPYVVLVLFLSVVYWINNDVVSQGDFLRWLALDIRGVKGQYAAWACVSSSMWFLQVFIIVFVLTPVLNWALERPLLNYVIPVVLVALVAIFTFIPTRAGAFKVFGWIEGVRPSGQQVSAQALLPDSIPVVGASGVLSQFVFRMV